ncbi:ABC transporter permease [Lentzea terrae]|uniref:ABC transporter permease n=1 Tax=Lentzea terrae TaxID=2200761 RepID=UPI000DD4BE2E|nr:ABC transporter permease [Lentzea terrae]
MSNALRHVFAAELRKLATLPAVHSTVAITVLATPGLALAAGFRAVEYGQLGLILVGVLTAAGEYGGKQIRTSLVCVPNRPLLLSGKVLAYLAVATPTTLFTGALSIVAAEVPATELPGTAVYLIMIGLLALAIAVLLRSVAGAVATLTTLVLVVSPLLAAATDAAEYLPDRAGASLYRPGVLSPWEGGAVMAAWLVITFAVAVVTFTRRDA